VTRASLGSVAAIALAAVALAPRAARADDVRACIAASTDAQTLRQQGHLLAARDQAIACARDACPSVVRSQCSRWVTELRGRIPAITVRVQDASGADVLTNVRFTIDGALGRLDGRPVELDPGEHTVEAVTDAGERVEQKVLLAESEEPRPLVLRLAPPPAPPHAPSSSANLSPAEPPRPAPPASTRIPLGAWIAGGLGVAAFAGATYFGLAAKGQLDTLNSSCSPHCTDAQTQPGRSDALAFDVLLGVGGAAAGTAIVWALFFPSAAPIELHPTTGGASVGWTLRY
jgi:hypothetical protein